MYTIPAANFANIGRDVANGSQIRAVCSGIAGNPDLSGIGVRLALYIQSAINSAFFFFYELHEHGSNCIL